MVQHFFAIAKKNGSPVLVIWWDCADAHHVLQRTKERIMSKWLKKIFGGSSDPSRVSTDMSSGGAYSESSAHLEELILCPRNRPEG